MFSGKKAERKGSGWCRENNYRNLWAYGPQNTAASTTAALNIKPCSISQKMCSPMHWSNRVCRYILYNSFWNFSFSQDTKVNFTKQIWFLMIISEIGVANFYLLELSAWSSFKTSSLTCSIHSLSYQHPNSIFASYVQGYHIGRENSSSNRVMRMTISFQIRVCVQLAQESGTN